jgi:sulfate permease, SulP family
MLAVAALVGVLVLDILYGILLAIALSIGALLRRVARPPDAVLERVAGMHDIDGYPTAATIPGLVVYGYDSPLFFANAQNLRRRGLAAVEEHRPVYWFVLNLEADVEVDMTGLDALEQLRAELTEQHSCLKIAEGRVRRRS